MDPLYGYGSLGSFGGGGAMAMPGANRLPGSQSSSTPKWAWVAGGVICIAIIAVAVVLYMRSSSGSKDGDTNVTLPGVQDNRSQSISVSSSPSFFSSTELPIAPSEADSKLATFAFELLEKPGHVPDRSGKLVKKPAGNPPYKLVQCGGSGYAIRWGGRYLTVDEPTQIVWSELKQEPRSCFEIVPGYCGSSNQYVMLRSKYNKLFLRVDDATSALVCKDGPTARTSKKYCWKINPDVDGIQPCGCTYSYDLKRVVCTPCDVVKTVGPGQSCSTATRGYQATCCLAKGPKEMPTDKHCVSIVWPEVVGKQVKEAMLYIRTRRPDLTLRPCPEPCAISTYPSPIPTLVIIPYDARTGYVTSPARLAV